MILIVNICKEPFHALEFVEPIEDILRANNFSFFTKHYLSISQQDIKKADKVIICGTSLADNSFLKNVKEFLWLKNYKKPVLGICGGAHIIGLLIGQKIKKNKEIGLKEITLKNEFLGIKGKLKVYHLHQFNVLPEVFHKDNFYAALFHPEVRNKDMIVNFCRL